MGIEAPEVILDQTLYVAGDNVTGRVRFNIVKQAEKIRAIKLMVSGVSTLTWWETKKKGIGKKKTTVKKKKTQMETFFSRQIMAVEQGEHILEIGDQEFPFTFKIPNTGVHGSFKSMEKGAVSWQVKAEIDVPWGFDKAGIAPLHVNIIRDLNQHLETSQPLDDSKQKTFGTMCCESGPLEINLNMPKTGFVSGETAIVNLRVENNSNKSVAIKVTLVQKVTFGKLRDWKIPDEIEQIQRHVVKKCSPNSSETLVHQMKIPPLAPSTMKMNGSIDVEYLLQIDGDPDGVGLDLTMLVPIVIGNIPLVNTFGNFPKAESIPFAMQFLPEEIRTRYPEIPRAQMGCDRQGLRFLTY